MSWYLFLVYYSYSEEEISEYIEIRNLTKYYKDYIIKKLVEKFL
jgi:hypothetical protein